MKKIIISLIATVIMAVAMPFASQSQSLTGSQRAVACVEMRKQLPAEVAEGMTWTNVAMENNNTVIHFTFKLNERKMGTTLREAKNEFSNMSAAQFRQLAGNDFTEMLNMFGCDGRCTFIFSDGTSTTFPVSR